MLSDIQLMLGIVLVSGLLNGYDARDAMLTCILLVVLGVNAAAPGLMT